MNFDIEISSVDSINIITPQKLSIANNIILIMYTHVAEAGGLIIGPYIKYINQKMYFCRSRRTCKPLLVCH